MEGNAYGLTVNCGNSACGRSVGMSIFDALTYCPYCGHAFSRYGIDITARAEARKKAESFFSKWSLAAFAPPLVILAVAGGSLLGFYDWFPEGSPMGLAMMLSFVATFLSLTVLTAAARLATTRYERRLLAEAGIEVK